MLVCIAVAVVTFAAASSGDKPASRQPARPKLVVVLVIDQLRPDYLTRFRALFLPPRTADGPGGFNYLTETGASYLDARHDHFPISTGPGHAAIFTGAAPGASGIVGNEWFDRELRKRRRCVEDPNVPQVGTSAGSEGIAPSTLLVSTVGDELKMATGGRAKVWGVAIKARSAVLMAGHLADGALWFDEATGEWVTSRAYAKNGTLPGWVAELNGLKKVDALFGSTWTSSLPASALSLIWNPRSRNPVNYKDLGASFPHRLDGGLTAPGKRFYEAFRSTPWSDSYVFETARLVVRKAQLGSDDVPDLLAVGPCALDYVGHYIGSETPEALDMLIRIDRDLSGFLGDLDRGVPGGLANVLVVMTSDHGVAPVVQSAREDGLPAGNYDVPALRAAAEKALDGAYGQDDWTEDLVDWGFWLDERLIARKKIRRAEVEQVAADAMAREKGIYAAWTRTAILSGRIPNTDLGRRVSRSFHPRISADVLVIPESGWVMADPNVVADHGEPYAYGTAAPLILAGAGVRAGAWSDRVSTLDIAPTLAAILGILPPSGSEGRILPHALPER